MEHTLSLSLKPGRVEGTVSCDDHAECPANRLIREDAADIGRWCVSPNFFEWYDGPTTPVRSGKVHLVLSERFVKWSYMDESPEDDAKPVPCTIENSEYSYFYVPMFQKDWGLLHKLLGTTSCRDDEFELEVLEESLIGFIDSYFGKETEYRTGFIRLFETGADIYGEKELSWEYAESLN